MTPTIPERINLAEHFLGDRLREGMGHREALRTAGGSLTYAEVDDLAHRFGHLLLEAGVRPEERVIVALPDAPEFVAALFGAIRIGAVGVMVNPKLAPDRIRGLYEQTRARAAFIDGDGRDAFGEAAEGARHAPRLLEVGSSDFETALEAAPETVETFPSHRDDPAIWLFSGGTTGAPKAVVQSHRSFVNTTELYAGGVLGIGPDDVTLSVPKLYFGYATGANLLFPFSVGATAALFSERCTADALFDRIEEFRPTILVNVPTMVNRLVSAPDAPRRDLSSLRLATSAGEALPVELHRRWDELFGVPLLDGLGTAEMWHIFVSNRPGDVRRGTLGRVVPGFEVRACDEEGVPAGPGEVGRLRVKGDSLAHGYWQNADRTRESFRGPWYVSGDLVRIDAEGYVTYCGRADDMLKVSGKWLSPGEVESCLLEHEAVAEVAVVGVATEEGLIKPHAFVVASGHARAGVALAEALQAWVRERLEPYKYPREVVFLEELPRTHLGKVDRGKLAGSG